MEMVFTARGKNQLPLSVVHAAFCLVQKCEKEEVAGIVCNLISSKIMRANVVCRGKILVVFIRKSEFTALRSRSSGQNQTNSRRFGGFLGPLINRADAPRCCPGFASLPLILPA
jgi:hypothetical protein